MPAAWELWRNVEKGSYQVDITVDALARG